MIVKKRNRRRRLGRDQKQPQDRLSMPHRGGIDLVPTFEDQLDYDNILRHAPAAQPADRTILPAA